MLTLALSAGVLVSVLCQEVIGLVPGGVIVPGYVALILDRPLAVATLLAIALMTVGIVRFLGPHLLLFGTRRFGVAILVGMVLSTAGDLTYARWGVGYLEWSGLGYVVPGILAHQCDRQGIVRTIALTIACASLVRLMMLVVFRA